MAKQENERAMDPLLDAPAEVNALPGPPAAPVRSSPTFGERVARFFRFLLRLVLLVIILAALIFGLSFGLPLLYQEYVLPVERNTTQMRELQSWREQAEQDLADVQTKLGTLETMQNEHDQSLTEIDRRVEDLETEIAARTESLAALETLQAELQEQNETASAELERQISLMKSMELLSRAHLFMYQSNFGLARQDVQMARDLLATLQPNAPEPLSLELEEVVLRLDMTLSNLPNFPVAASDDLDIAWQILLSGLPEATPTVSGTATATAAGTGTPSSTPIATFTPTPRGTPQPSATP